MVIRLGDIKFLNSWPVTYALREGGVPENVSIITGTPADLNRRLLTGELDASAVSSALFLRHLEELVPIPNLCIRSDSGVHSVLLVSRRPLATLRGVIGVSNQGATTPLLLKILLNRRGLKLRPEVTGLRYPEILEEYPAALLIGDEALDVSQKEEKFFTWDLGEAWTNWTRLPMIFALWAVRRPLVDERPELLEGIGQALRSSLAWGKSHQDELIAAMRKVFPWEANFLRRYLEGLSYDLDAKAWLGLRRFAKEAEAIGELPKGTTKRLGKVIRGRERTDLISAAK